MSDTVRKELSARIGRVCGMADVTMFTRSLDLESLLAEAK